MSGVKENVASYNELEHKLGNTFVIEWFAGINCIILWSQI